MGTIAMLGCAYRRSLKSCAYRVRGRPDRGEFLARRDARAAHIFSPRETAAQVYRNDISCIPAQPEELRLPGTGQPHRGARLRWGTLVWHMLSANVGTPRRADVSALPVSALPVSALPVSALPVSAPTVRGAPYRGVLLTPSMRAPVRMRDSPVVIQLRSRDEALCDTIRKVRPASPISPAFFLALFYLTPCFHPCVTTSNCNNGNQFGDSRMQRRRAQRTHRAPRPLSPSPRSTIPHIIM